VKHLLDSGLIDFDEYTDRMKKLRLHDIIGCIILGTFLLIFIGLVIGIIHFY
jgi:hypothetical protein